ncbi:MAG: glycosyltransferase family 2 protein [Mariprofundales bacterium]
MNIKSPLVSIGLPTYNREKLLQQTINAVLSQTYYNIELVISNNNSTDTTDSICCKYAEMDKRVKYTNQVKNIGPTANFNYVLEHADGEYFMWLSDDDWIDANYIEECLLVLMNDETIAVVAGMPQYYIDDVFAYKGLKMNITNKKPSQRVRSYFSQVKHNGIFYGLMRMKYLRGNKLDNFIGADLLLAANMAYYDKLITISSTKLHRRRGGSSNNSKELITIMGLSWFDYYFPRLAVAKNVFSYIALNKQVVFAEMNFYNRYIIAIQCVILGGARKLLSIIFPKRFCE